MTMTTSTSHEIPKKLPVLNQKPGFIAQIIYTILLTIIHAIYYLYKVIQHGFHRIVNFYLVTIRTHKGIISADQVVADMSRMDKSPNHVAVILPKDQTLAEELHGVAQLACWCSASGVSQLTVYTANGALKEDIVSIYKAIARCKDTFFAPRAFVPNFIIQPTKQFTRSNGKTKNNARDLEINVVSKRDGRHRLVSVSKALALKAKQGSINTKDITVEYLDDILSKEMSEPQLLLDFNASLDLQGYPPWQLRLTEIYHVEGNSRIDYAVFLRGMYAFSKCEMRIGK